MKIAFDRALRYNEVDPRLRLKPVCLFQLFQEAAVAHTEQVGLRTQDLLQQGFAWMMHKIAVKIDSCPKLDHSLRLRTWSCGLKGYQARREFEILADGQPAVAASSVWFAVDLNQGRIQRIPEAMTARYTVEPAEFTELNPKAWKPAPFPDNAWRTGLALRPSDFDPYGHVNNAVYLDYLDAALDQQGLCLNKAASIRLVFKQGITASIRQIEVETAGPAESMAFRMISDDTVFTEGQVSL
jgi:acyl-ACP thioesterase